MVIDFQHHYVPVELAKKRGLYAEETTYLKEGGLRATTMHKRLYDLDLQLREMSEAGIDVSVLSCLLGWSAPMDECRLINDDLAKVQANYPGKFVGLAQAPVLEGQEAIQEIDRAVRNLGLKGITITSQTKGVSLDAPKLYDLYEKICELDVPIFVHPALAPVGYDLLQDYDLPRVLGREVDLTVATTRLIAGGVLDRFPDLKLVIAHFGGGIAAVKDRLLAKGYRFGTLKRPFADYFDMLYFDLAGFEGGLAALHCALQGIRPERLLFASDYPQDFTGVNTDTGRGMKELKAYIDAVRALALSDATKEAILGRTAAQLLKL
ncbi:MAG TPA: amidohydrolase family protein [Candidatus Polarisedimenticolia bacterium]|nr:amidohydrolase family protein [Candidatus Polarisedimenticolia bacterium]